MHPTEFMAKTSYSTFIDLLEMELIEQETQTKEDFYGAQLAYIAAVAGGANKVNFKDFLFFTEKEKKHKPDSIEYMNMSKSAWGAATNKKAKHTPT